MQQDFFINEGATKHDYGESSNNERNTVTKNRNTAAIVSLAFLIFTYLVTLFFNVVILSWLLRVFAIIIAIKGLQTSKIIQKGKILSIVVIVLAGGSLLASLALSAVYYKKTGRYPFLSFESLDVLKQKESVKQVLSTVFGDPSEWQEYTHSFYGYSIKYPYGWEIKTDEVKDGFGQGIVQFIDKQFKCVLSLSLNPDPREDTTVPLNKESIDESLRDQVQLEYGGEVKNFPVAGTFGIIVEYPDDESLNAFMVAKEGKTALAFGFGSPRICKPVMREMFSTFQFGSLNEKRDESQKLRDIDIPVISVNGWREYNNEKYGYAFSYPPTFTLFASVNTKNETILPPTPQSNTVYITNNKAQLFCCEPELMAVNAVEEVVDLTNWQKYITIPEDMIVSQETTEIDGRLAYRIESQSNLGNTIVALTIIRLEKSSLLITQSAATDVWNMIINSFSFSSP